MFLIFLFSYENSTTTFKYIFIIKSFFFCIFSNSDLFFKYTVEENVFQAPIRYSSDARKYFKIFLILNSGPQNFCHNCTCTQIPQNDFPIFF